MSAHIACRVRRGFYLDSVALMRIAQQLRALDGVEDAVLMMGSESNREIMRNAGLMDAAAPEAGPNDLVLSVRGIDAAAAGAALDAAEAALARPEGGGGEAAGAARHRSQEAAAEALGDANLALISVPGAFAAREARRALAAGMNVMIFSDNVPLAEERALKEDAARRGLLVMGPDCGTAYLAGVPIAFANRVPRGPVGVIAASGTGLQEVAVLLARAGSGISHGLGLGGRDLGDDIGGLSALAAIGLLAGDPDTGHILLVSKPPGAATAGRVYAALAACGKPATVCLLGASAPVPDGLGAATTLKGAVEAVLGAPLATPDFDAAALADSLAARLEPGRTNLAGLFTGGTLCTEAQVVLREAALVAFSNAPLDALAAKAPPGGHRVLDLGADEYTVGRPHPMIEPAVRAPALAAALADPAVAVVLLDVVLGLGAHPDPAGAVCEVLAAHRGPAPVVIASVCGTREDPQDLRAQSAALVAAGVSVAPSNADAAALAAAVLAPR